MQGARALVGAQHYNCHKSSVEAYVRGMLSATPLGPGGTREKGSDVGEHDATSR